MINKIRLFASVCAVVALATGYAEENGESAARPKPSHEEMREKIRQASYRASGGYVRKADSARGCVAVLNAQKKVDEQNLRTAMAVIDKMLYVRMNLVNLEGVKIDGIKAELDKAGSALGVAVVDDGGLPTVLTAPETGWAIVNVAALAKDAPASDVLAARTRKELLRAFALIGGCSNMVRGPMIMGNVSALSDLDNLKIESYGADAVMAIRNYLPGRGVVPWHQTTYRKACQEGWALAPTNEVQKRIWDKVHAIPQKPIKIEYNEKRDKGK